MNEFIDENGELHRANGPALYYMNYYGWVFHGLPHRYYGPQNNNTRNWMIHGNLIK